jgi:hypothetical protein
MLHLSCVCSVSVLYSARLALLLLPNRLANPPYVVTAAISYDGPVCVSSPLYRVLQLPVQAPGGSSVNWLLAKLHTCSACCSFVPARVWHSLLSGTDGQNATRRHEDDTNTRGYNSRRDTHRCNFYSLETSVLPGKWSASCFGRLYPDGKRHSQPVNKAVWVPRIGLDTAATGSRMAVVVMVVLEWQ